MNIAQALKAKNRLAGELNRKQQILSRENARRSDSVSKIDRESVWKEILVLSEQLGNLKGRITQANVAIYPMLERMSELKSRISFIEALNKKEGEEIDYYGRDNQKVTYKWDSFINQEFADLEISKLQKEIDYLQDKVDAYNATTQIPD